MASIDGSGTAETDATAQVPHPEPVCRLEFSSPYLIELGVAIIREVPSKHLNAKAIDSVTLKKYRNTNEEANASVNPLLVLKCLLMLAASAENGSKTENQILTVIRYIFNKSCGKTFTECNKKFKEITCGVFAPSTHPAIVRLFFEQRDINPINKEFVSFINQMFREESVNGIATDHRNVVNEINFAIDPTGETIYNRLNSHMCAASFGKVKTVVRRDLAPDWKARMIAAGASYDAFQISVTSALQPVRKYFYDGLDEDPKYRTIAKCLTGTAFVKRFENNEVRFFEFPGVNPKTSLVIVIPKEELLSHAYLKKFEGTKFCSLYLILTAQEPSECYFTIPALNILSPLSIRPVFDKAIYPLFNILGMADPFAMPHVFSPYKAEFASIIGKKSDTPSRIFAVYDFFVGSKFSIATERPASIIAPVIPPHHQPKIAARCVVSPSIVTQSASAKLMMVSKPDGNFQSLVIELKGYDLDKVVPVPIPPREHPDEIFPSKPLPLPPPTPQPHVPSVVLSREKHSKQKRSRLSASTIRIPKSLPPMIEVVPASASRAIFTPSKLQRVRAGADDTHEEEVTATTGDTNPIPAAPVPEPQPASEHSCEPAFEGVNEDPILNLNPSADTVNVFHPQIPVREMSRTNTLDSPNNATDDLFHGENRFTLPHEVVPDLRMSGPENAVLIDKPFLFMVLHRDYINDQHTVKKIVPLVIGRFTNIEEVYDEPEANAPPTEAVAP